MRTALPVNPNSGVHYPKENLRTIYLAGGCFWGTQAFLTRILGVAHTRCGYANGHTPNPTYEQVCHENTGHAEAVLTEYDHTVLSLDALLHSFWKTLNPTQKNRQGNDVGSQYRSGIYYTDAADLPVIQASLAEEQKRYTLPIVTEVMPLQCFYEAEDYHQDYLEQNPGGYCHVDFGRLPQERRA